MSIYLDWGTSAFRAWRLDEEGTVLARHAAPCGIATVEGGDFAGVLQREIGAWLSATTQVTLSGMISSRNGWVETPYAPLPARLEDLARHALRRTAPWGAPLTFLPGVAAFGDDPDVVRGEEIQLFGAVPEGHAGVVLLPGTHAKWMAVADGAIRDVATYLTGEIFALLLRHSIIGRLVPDDTGQQPEAFAQGVALARREREPGDLLHDIFTARSRTLIGGMAPAEIPDFLSGLLIGAEIRAGLARMPTQQATLAGEAALVARYATALASFGIATRPAPPEAALAGFRLLRPLLGGA
jgi:2-dehydro-3-deoxygalactonokinase